MKKNVFTFLLIFFLSTIFALAQKRDTVYIYKVQRDTVTLHHYYNPNATLLSDRKWYQRFSVGPSLTLGYTPFDLKLVPSLYIGFGVLYSLWP